MGRPLTRPTKDAYVHDAVVNALAEGGAKAGDYEAALRTMATVKVYPAGASVWQAIGSAAGRQGAAEAVLAQGPGRVDIAPGAVPGRPGRALMARAGSGHSSRSAVPP
jgi:hypothetical protein